MRLLPLIAAALLASTAAHAQVYGSGCRSDTMSGLANCVAANTPPPAELAEQEEMFEDLGVEDLENEPGTGAGTFRAQTLSPVALGGTLRPTNLRADRPIVNLQSDQVNAVRQTRSARRATARLPRFRGNRGNFTGPFRFDPLAGTGIRR